VRCMIRQNSICDSETAVRRASPVRAFSIRVDSEALPRVNSAVLGQDYASLPDPLPCTGNATWV